MQGIEARLRALSDDHVRGASAIARELCDIVRDSVLSLEWSDPETAATAAQGVLHRVRALRPSFALPQRLALLCSAAIKSTPPLELSARLSALLDAERRRLDASPREIAARAAPILPLRGTVATVSAGETVRATLLAAHAAGRVARVLIAESRPLREGVGLARALAAAGLDVAVVADAALPGLVDAQTTGLVGADRLTEDAMIGKIGSYPLALALARIRRPLLLTADTGKILPRSLAPEAEEVFDPEEILESAGFTEGGRTIAVRNVYFESVPLRLVSRVITEEGIWTRGDVRRYALRLPGRLNYFANLVKIHQPKN